MELPEDAATPPIRERMQTRTKDKPSGNNDDQGHETD